MGEAADDILNGLVCQECGEWMDDILNGADEPGYPRTCDGCQPQRKQAQVTRRKRK
jgi:hypothetical protein